MSMYVNIYVMWHRLYNFLLGRRDADIIDLNYIKEWECFVCFNNQIISGNYSKMTFLVILQLLSLQKLYL